MQSIRLDTPLIWAIYEEYWFLDLAGVAWIRGRLCQTLPALVALAGLGGPCRDVCGQV
jgi:hypothetical protein